MIRVFRMLIQPKKGGKRVFRIAISWSTCTNCHPTKFSGSTLNTIRRTVKYLCPADIIPPYIDVDLSELDVGQKLTMGDLKVHPALKLLKSKDEPVCKIMGARVSDQQRRK